MSTGRTLGRLIPRLIIAVIAVVLLRSDEVWGERGGRATPKLSAQGGAAHAVPPLTGEFAVREELRPAVDFWKGIFGLYNSDQALIHHAHELDVVYSVLDFSDLEGNPRAGRIRKGRIASEITRVQAMLRKLSRTSSPAKLTEKERSIYELLKGGRRGGFSRAAERDNIHVQSGISDRFRLGLMISRRYIPEIEEIFREAGLPPQLTRMPFVESTFNVDAHSSAGASGIWQFIPSTGRLYMKVGKAVDERRDPLFATRAATKLLRHNYSVIRSWPLAVTAYNHGLGGVQRAVRSTGTRDIVQIIKRYRGSRFGYASRNFFVELLAAIEVERSYVRYFGNLKFDPPFAYDEFRLDRPVLAKNLQSAGMSRTEIANLNPALSERTLSNYYSIPAGMKLRAPLGRGEAVVAKLNGLSSAEFPSASSGGSRRHRVRKGESLSSVARRYGVSRHALARANGLSSRAHLRIGQRLKLPGSTRTRVSSASFSKTGRRAVFLRRSDPARTYKGGGWTAPPDTRVADNRFDATGLVLGEGAPASAPPPRQPVAPETVRQPPAEASRAPVAEPVPPAPPESKPRDKPLSSPGAATDAPPPQIARKAPEPEKPKRPAEVKTAKETRTVTHVVRRRETLSGIARKYKTTLTRVRRANAGKKLEPLLPGTRLVIPVKGTTHVVRRNETLWGIAKRYKVTLSQLRQANREKRLKPLRPGTRLHIPG